MITEALRKARATSLHRLRRFGTTASLFEGQIPRDNPAGLREALQGRKGDRLWEREFFRSEVVRRIPFGKWGDVSELLSRLKALSVLRSRLTPEEVKASRERGIEALNRGAIAAQVIRHYVACKSQIPDSVDSEYLLQVADEIEKWPIVYAPRQQYAIDVLLNPILAGQQGGFTAYAINVVDEVLPTDTANRDATIRDVLDLIDVRATNQLVRSIRNQLTRSPKRARAK